MGASDFMQSVIANKRRQIFDFRQLFRGEIQGLFSQALEFKRVRLVEDKLQDRNDAKCTPL